MPHVGGIKGGSKVGMKTGNKLFVPACRCPVFNFIPYKNGIVTVDEKEQTDNWLWYVIETLQ